MKAKEFICKQCLSVGAPRRVKRGSKTIESIGWMIFPIGLPYTLWRIFSKYNACRDCLDGKMISVETPEGQALLEQFDKKILGYEAKKTEVKFDIKHQSKTEFQPQNKISWDREPKSVSAINQRPDEW